jgi:hypothetical protein
MWLCAGHSFFSSVVVGLTSSYLYVYEVLEECPSLFFLLSFPISSRPEFFPQPGNLGAQILWLLDFPEQSIHLGIVKPEGREE